MKKRWISTMLVGTMIGSLCTGCGSQSSKVDKSEFETVKEDTNSNQKVKMKVWGSEADGELIQSMIDSFVEAHRGKADFDITFEAHEEVESKNDGLSNVQECADVFSMPDDQLSAFAAAGVCKPVANAEQIKKANIDGALEAATVNGDLYAYPMTADNGYFLYYNKKYLKESDVETLDKLLEVAAKQNKYFSMDWASGWYLYSFFANTGLELGLNDDGITNHCNWDSTEGDMKGVDVAQALWDIAGNPGFKMMDDAGFKEGAKDGSVIAGVSGVWLAPDLEAAWGKNLGATKLPTYTCKGEQIQMGSYSGYKLIGVNSYSQNREWAAKLAEWMTNEENQQLRFEQRGNVPSNKNAAGSSAVTGNVANKGLIAQSAFASLQRVGGNYWEPALEFGIMMAKHDLAGKSMQSVLDVMVEKIEAIN